MALCVAIKAGTDSTHINLQTAILQLPAMMTFILAACIILTIGGGSSAYNIGTGRYDITGPATQITFVSFLVTSPKIAGYNIIIVTNWEVEVVVQAAQNNIANT